MPGARAATVHQLKIGLQGTAPPLWRRIQVPSAASLGFLHDVIQVAFGWEGHHLHRFRDGRGREWGEPAAEDDGFPAATFADEEEAQLGGVLRAEGAVLEYVYDFGDGWLHRIEAETIMPLDPGVTYPRCTGGRRAPGGGHRGDLGIGGGRPPGHPPGGGSSRASRRTRRLPAGEGV